MDCESFLAIAISQITQSDFLVGRNCENDEIEDIFRKNEDFRDLTKVSWVFIRNGFAISRITQSVFKPILQPPSLFYNPPYMQIHMKMYHSNK